MTPLELSIIKGYYSSPKDPDLIRSPLHQEICRQYCQDGVLRAIRPEEVFEHEGYGRPHYKITEKGRVYFDGIMDAASRVPLPVYVIPSGEKDGVKIWPPLYIKDVPQGYLGGLSIAEWMSGKNSNVPG